MHEAKLLQVKEKHAFILVNEDVTDLSRKNAEMHLHNDMEIFIRQAVLSTTADTFSYIENISIK